MQTNTDDTETPEAPGPAVPPDQERTPGSERPPDLTRVGLVLLFAASFLGSAVLLAIGQVTGLQAPRLIGAYGLLFFGVGAAPFQLRLDLGLYARLAGAIIVGFGVLLVIGAVMADVVGAWYPYPAAVLVLGAAVALHVIGLVRARAAVSRDAVREVFTAVRLPSRLTPASQASLWLTLVGTILWLVEAVVTRDPNPGSWGMLAALSPVWYLGLILVITAFAIGCRAELPAGLSTLSFGLASTLTPALVYGTPRIQTAAKQVVLTDYVLRHHHIAVTSGIYPAYSALFAGIAWMSHLLGLYGVLGGRNLLGLATYWPVLILFMRVAVLRLLVDRLLPTTARRWTAVFLVLLVDVLGQDYFSPQSVGYVMALAVIGLVIRGRRAPAFGERANLWLLLVTGVALAPTHELTPYLAAGALIVLAIFRQAPRWAWAPIAVPALAWVGVVHKAVSSSFSFSALFDISNFRPPQTAATPGLSRLPIVGYNSHALLAALLLLIALAAIGFFANVRQRRVWAYALCPIVGLSFIAINPYGNEGIFRATIFALPWLAILAMEMPPPAQLVPALRRPPVKLAATLAVLLGFGALFLPASYAMDGPGVIRRSELALFNYVLAQPTDSNFVIGLGPDIDTGFYPPPTANYDLLTWDDEARALRLLTRHPTVETLTAFEDAYGLVAERTGAVANTRLYVYYSPSMVEFAQDYGLMTPEQLRSWLDLLKASPVWSLVFHRDDSYLFQLR